MYMASKLFALTFYIYITRLPKEVTVDVDIAALTCGRAAAVEVVHVRTCSVRLQPAMSRRAVLCS